MAELILPENRHLFLDVLDDMHERRYKLFFENLGWCPDECGVQRGYDKDAFDTDESVYIVELLPGTRKVAGFARMNPTTGLHMMADLFPHFCDYPSGVPIGPDIQEVSRLGYDFDLLNRDRNAWKEVRGRITGAIVEYCLSRGINQVTYCVHDNVFTSIQKDTWGAIPLGSPQRDEKLGKIYQTGISDMTIEGLNRCKAMLDDPSENILNYYGPVSAVKIPVAA